MLVAATLVASSAAALLSRAALAQLDQPLPEPPGRRAAPPAPKLTKAPTIKKSVDPVYPPEAFAAGLAGDVTLLLDLGSDGSVTNVLVSRGAGHGFDEAAVTAAKQMQFTPAEVDEKPAAIRIEYTIHFQPKVVPSGQAAPDGGVGEPSEADAGAPATPPALAGPPADAGAPASLPAVVLQGRARERGTREPLIAADVAVIRRGAGPDGTDLPAAVVGVTDEQGKFEVRLPDARAAAAGPLRVIVSDTTHEPCIRDFTAGELAGPVPPFWTCLAPRRNAGQYQTSVHGRSEHVEENKATLTRAELTTVPGTAGDPIRALQDLPGVARAPFGLGLLIVRGASPNETGVFIGGEPVPLLYHFLAGPSIFSSYLLDKIDFYPGGFGVRYGRFAGGAVDISIKGEVGRTFHGAADINLRDSSAFVESPVGGGWRASAAVRRSYIDLLLPLIIKPKVGSTFVTFAPVYWDYQARVERDLPSGGRLAFVAFGSDDSISVVAQDPTQTLTSDNHIGFHHVNAELLTSLGGWTSRFSPTYGYGNQSFSTGTFDGFQRYHRLYVREDLTRRFGPRFTLAAGIDTIWSYDWADFYIPLPRNGRSLGNAEPDPTDVVRTLYDIAPAAYVEGQWEPHPKIRIVPGVRFDYYHIVGTDKESIDPRLSVRWALTPRLALKASAGVYHELPIPEFLDREFGNPNLALPWAEQYQLGVEKKITDADDVTATGYFIRRHDLPVPSIDHFSSDGRGRSYGLEIWLRHQVTRHFYGWLAYTLSKSETAGPLAGEIPMGGMGMPRNGSDLSWRPAEFDQTHNLVVVASYRWTKWETGATYRLTTGTPTTPVVGSFYDADYNGYTRLNGATGSTRNPAFSQLDVRIERTWTFDYWILGAYLDVQNVLNAQNPEGILYDYRYHQSAPLRGLPILPIFGVRGRF